MELYRKHRPKDLDGIIGQPEAVSILKQKIETNNIPHAILLAGPSGTGKTTLVRILRSKLECSKRDFRELNCAADSRGIDTIRDIKARMTLAPMGGKSRIWYFDECHQITNDAQSGMLKMLEDPPEHAYFFFSTTDPEKMIKTVLNRCTTLNLRPLNIDEILALIRKVAKAESKKLTEEVCDKIAMLAEGSARKALVILDSIIHLKTEEEQLETIERSDHKSDSITIAQALFKRGIQWPEMAKILKKIKSNDIEKIRWGVLGYANAILLKGGVVGRAAKVIEEFQLDFFNSKEAGLSLACFRVICGK